LRVLKTKVLQFGTQTLIPCSRRLFETIQSLIDLANVERGIRVFIPRRLIQMVRKKQEFLSELSTGIRM
jgi:hypothetical protein